MSASKPGKVVVLEEAVLSEPAQGLQATGYGLQAGESGSGSFPKPGAGSRGPRTFFRERWGGGHREPGAASEASSERVRRFPIGFQPDGTGWIAAQTGLFDLEPLRIVVCEPSEDAVLCLHFGTAEFLFRQWRLGEGETVHSKELHSWGSPDDPVVWKPGELARIEVLAGTISGAAFVARKKGTS